MNSNIQIIVLFVSLIFTSCVKQEIKIKKKEVALLWIEAASDIQCQIIVGDFCNEKGEFEIKNIETGITTTNDGSQWTNLSAGSITTTEIQ